MANLMRNQSGAAPARRASSNADTLLQPLFFPERWLGRDLINAVLPAIEMAEAFVPNVELSEKDGNYILDVALPGFKPEDIEIEVSGNQVTISGTYEQREEDSKKRYSEMRQASFARTLTLPQDIDVSKVTATFENGILRITAPPVSPSPTKKVAISNKSSSGQSGGA